MSPATDTESPAKDGRLRGIHSLEQIACQSRSFRQIRRPNGVLEHAVWPDRQNLTRRFQWLTALYPKPLRQRTMLS